MRYGRHLRHRRHSRHERHGTAIADWQAARDRVAVTGVTVTPATATAAPGDTVALTAAIAPAGATDKTVTWTIKSGTGATLTPNGLSCNVVIDGETAAGSIVVEAKTTDGEFVDSATITVEVDEGSV